MLRFDRLLSEALRATDDVGVSVGSGLALRDELQGTGALQLAEGGPPHTSIDHEFLSALERGDHVRALQVLMRAYGDQIYHYCISQLRDPVLAADVQQLVFIQVYESLNEFSRVVPVKSWLFGIAHNRCIDTARVVRRHEGRVSPMDPLPDEPDPGPSCDDTIASMELAAMVNDCIDRLKKDARTATLLRYQEGLSYKDIGRMCRESPAALQQRVARAVQDLRRCLQKKGVQV